MGVADDRSLAAHVHRQGTRGIDSRVDLGEDLGEESEWQWLNPYSAGHVYPLEMKESNVVARPIYKRQPHCGDSFLAGGAGAVLRLCRLSHDFGIALAVCTARRRTSIRTEAFRDDRRLQRGGGY